MNNNDLELATPVFRYEPQTRTHRGTETDYSCLFCFILYHDQQMHNYFANYRGADKSLARPTSGCILFDGETISFDASLVIYI
jgi:hypothetical protein